jgi:hypothetical protein
MSGMVCPMFALSGSQRSTVASGFLAALLAFGGASAGCKSNDSETSASSATAADAQGRPLGDLELPVSLRSRDSQPSDAHALEATTEQLRLNGSVVLPLSKGEFADADKTAEGVVPKLEAALRAQSHNTLALRLQAIIPYETVALILNTAKQAGVMNASFQVRETGNSPKTGWLSADSFVMTSKADDLPPIKTAPEKSWDAFTAKWKQVTEACRSAPTGNCAYADANFAKGGTLKIELFASGRGININFFQRGLTPDQQHEEEMRRNKDLAKKKEQFLQGHMTHEQMVSYLLLGDPATQALFQFRYQEALSAPSALTGTIAPLCQGERCGVTVAADSISPMVRVFSMIGAAFPDGATGPAFAFEMPWTQKPKPTGLPEWAQRELEKNEILDGKVQAKVQAKKK